MKSFTQSLFPSLQRVQFTQAQSILQYLQISPDKLIDASTRDQLCSRVVDYYLPIYTYISDLVDQHRIKDEGPLLLGMSAPQGCGKTTLTGCLEYLFSTESKCCVVMSIDDFYFTGNAPLPCLILNHLIIIN
jgi:pantothenate kinase-related protein Tda10